MTGKGREDDRGNRGIPRFPFPGDSPLIRGMCAADLVCRHCDINVASALIHCQCPIIRFFLENKLLFCSVSKFKYCVSTTRQCQQSDAHDSRHDVNSVCDMTLLCRVPRVMVHRMSSCSVAKLFWG